MTNRVRYSLMVILLAALAAMWAWRSQASSSSALSLQPDRITFDRIDAGERWYQVEIVNPTGRPVRLLGSTEKCTQFGCIYVPEANGTILPGQRMSVSLKHVCQNGPAEGGTFPIVFFTDNPDQPRATLHIDFPPLD